MFPSSYPTPSPDNQEQNGSTGQNPNQNYTTNTTYVAPQYQAGADGHNLGNGNFALSDPSTWASGVESAAKFVAVSAASGLNSFYNTGVTVSNWLGSDAKQNDIAVQLADIDDDLGKYYRDNRSSADMAGFIMTSLVPGLGGIKVLNAGQKALRAAEGTGFLGANLSRATGLLAPSVEAYTIRASAEIAQATSTFKLLQGNTIKAIGAGFHQAALESAAFEIAVGVTAFKSPVLNGQDGYDIAKNIAVGTIFGGVIGGAISAAGVVGKVKEAVRRTSVVEKPFTDTTNLTGLTPVQKIIQRQEHLESMPGLPSVDDIVNGKVAGTQELMSKLTPVEAQETAVNLRANLDRLREETIISMSLKNRTSIHEITAGGDKEVGNQIADMLANLESPQLLNSVLHLQEVGRLSVPLKAEKELANFNKEQLKNITNVLDANAGAAKAPIKVGYLDLKGETQGAVSFERPKYPTLADDELNIEAVKARVAGFKFSESKQWDARFPGSIKEAEARYLWADTAKLENEAKIGEFDIPLLERAMTLDLPSVKIISKEGNFELNGAAQIQEHLQGVKGRTAYSLQAGREASVPETMFPTSARMEARAYDAANPLTSIEIGRVTNMRVATLDGDIAQDNARNYFARQAELADYEKKITEQGLHNSEQLIADYPFTPRTAKVAYDTKSLQDVDGMEIQGMAYLKAQQKVYAEGVNNVVASNMPAEILASLAHPTDAQLLGANRFGAGPKFAASANANYGSLGSIMESNGAVTARLQAHLKNNTSTVLESHAYNLAADQEASIAFEAINKAITSTSERYGINEAGTGIEPLKILDWKARVASGRNSEKPTLQEGAQEFIPFTNDKAADAWKARTGLTSDRTKSYQDLRNSQGLTDDKDFRALRAIRPDPKDYPFYAMVTDESISGVGHSSMIHAASAEKLDQLINKVPSNYHVWKGDQLKDYHKAYGDFDYNLSLHENYIDSSMLSKGVSNPFFPMTEAKKISERFLQDSLKSDDIFARELMNAKFEKEFSFLRQQGEAFSATEKSKYTGFLGNLESVSQNPYVNYIKTALNISQTSEHPYISGLNNKLDAAVSKTWNTLTSAFKEVKSPQDIAALNQQIEKAGIKTAYYDAATELLANHTADKGVLRNFVQTANSMMATTILRLDPLNAINNAVGATVAYGTETKSVINAINRGDSNAVGELAALTRAEVPSMSRLSNDPAVRAANGAPDTTLSAGKLMLNAVKNWTDKEAKTLDGTPLKEFYKTNGWSTRLVDQFHEVMDNMTLAGSETGSELSQRARKILDTGKQFAEVGEKYTGNKLAEEFNRFVAADTMRQISDIGVKNGLISKEEQISYINTFVNRTQGNILASQRPLMFQGPVGQSIGLFQTYQFNMMQQLFRHVAEGQGKDAAMLLGLQGTVYGMNGLPAFNYINTHIVGTASGNLEHRDIYDATYGIAGKSVGDMLLYGIPSNLLHANLYSRGDINPRQATIVPLNPADIPYVQATAKLYDNVKGMVGNIANGGSVWQSLLGGIEHNGLSRPLAGIAQIMNGITHEGKVFSTSSKGNMSGSNDLYSWATATRLFGGKPMDEAIVNDAAFRITAYQAADREKMDSLNKAVKTSVIAGNSPDAGQYANFAAKYAEAGGKVQNFNKYMIKQMKETDQIRADQIVNDLKSPYSQKMQNIMGGMSASSAYSGVPGNSNFDI